MWTQEPTASGALVLKLNTLAYYSLSIINAVTKFIV
jgi:hypothetical protein